MDKLQPSFLTRKMLDFEQSATFSLLVTTKSASFTSTTLTIQGMTKAGIFKYSCKVLSGGAKQEFTFRLPDIPVFISVIQEDVSFGPNNIWTIVKLRINDDVAIILMQGYPNEVASLSWPIQQVADPMSLIGALSTATAGPQDAGAEWTRTVGANQRWEIVALRFTLTTSATVANRRPTIRIAGPASTYFWIPVPATIVASQSSKINSYRGAVAMDDQINLIQTVPLPDKLILGPNSVISSVTANLQAGDQYTDTIFTLNIFYI